MRYMSWVRGNKDYGPPPAALMAAMAAAGDEQYKSGVMVDTGGLSTLAEGGGKLTLSGGKITDGPYSEAKEIVGGYAILNAESREAAIEGARWVLEVHKEHWPEWEGEVEIRQMYTDGGDFPKA